MKKILITGSAGFIAPHIAEQALNLGWQVIGVDIEEVDDKISDKRIKYIKSDLRDLNEDDIKDVDFVAHMAFVTNIPFSIQNPLSTTYKTGFEWSCNSDDGGGTSEYQNRGWGFSNATAQANRGFKFYTYDGDNIDANAKVTLYGFKN